MKHVISKCPRVGFSLSFEEARYHRMPFRVWPGAAFILFAGVAIERRCFETLIEEFVSALPLFYKRPHLTEKEVKRILDIHRTHGITRPMKVCCDQIG